MTALPVVLLSGAPASGKSTLSHLVARELRAAVIGQDVATAPLVEVVQRLVGIDDLDDPRLAGLTRDARYRVMLDLAVDNLAAWAATRDRMVAAGGTPLLVWLRLEPAEVLRRLRERAADRDAAKLTDEAAYLSGPAATAGDPPVVPHLALDATLPPGELARAVLDALPR
jgi:cytidylate kinase